MTELEQVKTKAADEKFCTECGSAIKIKAELCPKCGVRQISAPSKQGNVAPNGKSRMVAALLAFFLGGIGFHRFYLGQVGLGVLYILFCWTFIPAFVAIIDFILLLIMSDEAFNEKYGN